jgi:hypothetical protein
MISGPKALGRTRRIHRLLSDSKHAAHGFELFQTGRTALEFDVLDRVLISRGFDHGLFD